MSRLRDLHMMARELTKAERDEVDRLSKGWIETTPEGAKLVHWFDKNGNEHVNGMGAVLDAGTD